MEYVMRFGERTEGAEVAIVADNPGAIVVERLGVLEIEDAEVKVVPSLLLEPRSES